MDGKYTSTAQTVTDGYSAPVAIDSHRNLQVVMADSSTGAVLSSSAPAQTYRADSYLNITTKTTTVVKAAAGTLAKVVINKSGSSDTLTIYDNTAGSGTIIATITSPTVGMNFQYDVACGTGITIVTGGTTAGDYTVAYR